MVAHHSEFNVEIYGEFSSENGYFLVQTLPENL